MGPAQCCWDPRRWDWIPAFAGDVGWPGAIFIAMTLADTSCHVANYGASMVSGAIGTFLSTQNATTPVSSAQINLG